MMLTGEATKDPNAPKRGLSAYMFFANEQRENVRTENPGIAFGMYYYHYYHPIRMRYETKNLHFLQARLERSSERGGRLCQRSNVPHMRPKPPPTRRDTKMRRRSTRSVIYLSTSHQYLP